MHSWFDLWTLDLNGPEDAKGIRKAGELITTMLDEEIASSGIPASRVILGGFSQGGALAVHTAMKYHKRLAGIVALSCWLPLHKEYPAAALEANRDIPLIQCHGDKDFVVPFKWGQLSSEIIKSFNSNSEFKVYKEVAHSSSEEVSMIKLYDVRLLNHLFLGFHQ